jgi:arylsulfatase A-like enzyme
LIGKQNLYEHSVRVPLLLAGPDIAADQTTDAMCYLLDVLPTLGAMCGVPAPPKSEGLDLSTVLHGGAGGGREALVFAYKDVQRAIATREWKLIRYPKVDQTQLFNLRDDPHEIHNLADQPAHAGKVADLSARMKKELEAAGDTPRPANARPDAAMPEPGQNR